MQRWTTRLCHQACILVEADGRACKPVRMVHCCSFYREWIRSLQRKCESQCTHSEMQHVSRYFLYNSLIAALSLRTPRRLEIPRRALFLRELPRCREAFRVPGKWQSVSQLLPIKSPLPVLWTQPAVSERLAAFCFRIPRPQVPKSRWGWDPGAEVCLCPCWYFPRDCCSAMWAPLSCFAHSLISPGHLTYSLHGTWDCDPIWEEPLPSHYLLGFLSRKNPQDKEAWRACRSAQTGEKWKIMRIQMSMN